jgi:hypothetical protein
MSYEIFKTILEKEDYFSTWETDKLNTLNDEMKTYIYEKYKFKCVVFNRDNFVCQNLECKTPSSSLTIHHIKAVRNNGENKPRNGLTLCKSCHMGYERGRCSIVLDNIDTLPPHIRGHTFKIQKENVINWKQVKEQSKNLRREIKLKLDEGIKKLPVGQRVWFKITSEQINMLMKILTLPYDEWDD